MKKGRALPRTYLPRRLFNSYSCQNVGLHGYFTVIEISGYLNVCGWHLVNTLLLKASAMWTFDLACFTCKHWVNLSVAHSAISCRVR